MVTNCLITKCSKAIDLYKNKKKIKSFVLAGGVASNKFIRDKFINLCDKKFIQFIVPEQNLCVDNATMIAWAGIERMNSGNFHQESVTIRTRWPLDENASKVRGAGVKA